MSYQYGTKGGPLHSAQVGGLPRRRVATAYEKVLSGKLESTTVLTVDGSSSHVGAQRPGSNGGYFTVSSDGTWHFDPGSYFYSMAINEERTTSIACTINNGYNDISGDISVIVVSSYHLPWTPAEITTALWLDAADTSSMTIVSGKVSEWHDKSGNNSHFTQLTEAARPTLGDGIVFDGVDDWLGCPHTIQPNEASGYQAFFVTDVEGAAGGTLFTNRITGPLAPIQILTVGGEFYIHSDAVNVSSNHNIVAADFNALIQKSVNWFSIVPGSRITFATNAVIKTPTVGTCTTSTGSLGSRLGRREDGVALHFPGTVFEFIIINGNSIVLALRQKIEGYLAHKWGLVDNLPSDHPYKSAAPTL